MRGWITDSKSPDGVRLATDLPEPEPRDGELVMSVKAYGINRGELSLVNERPDGFRPGQDVAGIVMQTANRPGAPPVGARVLGLVDWYGWAERVAIPLEHVAVIPDAVSFERAATLPVSGVTALRAVRLGGELNGKNVLVTGAVGGVGQLAVQLATAEGAEVTALVRQHQKEEAKALGARFVVTALNDEGPRFELVLDGVGGATLLGALHRLVPDGTLAMYGVLAGKASLDIFDFASCPNAKLVGLFLHEPGPHCGEELAVLLEHLAHERLRPVIGFTDDWTHTAHALSEMRASRVRGKAILCIDC
jgi:NADPH:quinone reductase